jgi:branched-chain amino acid transport system permease protein
MKYQQQTLQQPAASVWVLLGMKAFVAAVVGGIGNLRGAMLGGLMIGLIENFGSQYISSEYRDVYVFLLLIVVLLIRPSGILGKATVEKV